MRETSPNTEASRELPAATWREAGGVAFLTALCDATIYRGHGYSGYAALFAAAPVLMLLAAPRMRLGWRAMILVGMLALLAARLAWCGSPLLGALGFALVVAFAMTLAGVTPHVWEACLFAGQTLYAGFGGVRQYARLVVRRGPTVGRFGWANLLLPIGAFLAFGTIFVLANPALLTWFGEGFQNFVARLQEVLRQYAPTPGEFAFCACAAWLAAGLLRPALNLQAGSQYVTAELVDSPFKPGPTPIFPALRNTLLTVIALFAVYLAFEFKTLWMREFPEGFYYSGYAHEGAAWLTFALAMATAMLSLVFRGATLRDPRLASLRRLAWVWSAENLLLAVAVYHRLFIYIGFNGMTRMRVVGMYGISAVVAGFLFVLWKIARNRDFVWLVRRHLWTLAAAVYLFALTPVDLLVHRYNVERILAGDPAPSVQIGWHPIDSQGILQLPPLLECDDPLIRDGVRALLAERLEALDRRAKQEADRGWTSIQISDRLARERLRQIPELKTLDGKTERDAMWREFKEYAYRWY